jgi:hypothetical protein
LDADVTIKPLYGHQEGAQLGYNPHKPGRPSHTLNTFPIANLRLVLDVEVQAERCRFMARMTALIYNWWSLFVRLADPHKHTERSVATS